MADSDREFRKKAKAARQAIDSYASLGSSVFWGLGSDPNRLRREGEEPPRIPTKGPPSNWFTSYGKYAPRKQSRRRGTKS